MKIQALNIFNHKRQHYFTFLTSLLVLLNLSTFGSVATAQETAEISELSVIKRAPPIYPKYAVKRGLEGAVLINFSIDTEGNASDIEVVASDQEGLFDASAILGVQKWVYKRPAQKVRNQYVSIEFSMSDKPNVSHFSNVEIIRVFGE